MSTATTAAPDHPLGIGKVVRAGDAPLYVFALPIFRDVRLLGVLALVHDASEIDVQGTRVMRDVLLHQLVQVVLIAASLLILRASVAGQIQKAASWIRSVHAGKDAAASSPALGEAFGPLAREVTDLVRSFDAARASAEQEAKLRNASQSRWTAERLRVSAGKLRTARSSPTGNPTCTC